MAKLELGMISSTWFGTGIDTEAGDVSQDAAQPDIDEVMLRHASGNAGEREQLIDKPL